MPELRETRLDLVEGSAKPGIRHPHLAQTGEHLRRARVEVGIEMLTQRGVVRFEGFAPIKRRGMQKPRLAPGLVGFCVGKRLLDRNVLGLRTLVALHDFEFDRVAFLQRLET